MMESMTVAFFLGMLVVPVGFVLGFWATSKVFNWFARRKHRRTYEMYTSAYWAGEMERRLRRDQGLRK